MYRLFNVLCLSLLLPACAEAPRVLADPGEESLLTFAEGRITCVAGSVCDPHAIRALPHEGEGSFAGSVNAVIAYDCDPEWWLGAEEVYAFDVQSPGTLEVSLDAAEGVAAFVVAVDERYTCKEGGARDLEVAVNPGRHWLVVDSIEATEKLDHRFSLALRETQTDDAFEPNDTLAQSAWIRMGDDEVKTFEAQLTPASPVDYFTFELDPISAFEVHFEGQGLELEIVTWDGVEPNHVEHTDGSHALYMTDPFIEDFGDPVYATLTVEVRMSAEAWEKGGVRYDVRAEHGYRW